MKNKLEVKVALRFTGDLRSSHDASYYEQELLIAKGRLFQRKTKRILHFPRLNVKSPHTR